MDDGLRTHDPRNHNPMLWPAELQPPYYTERVHKYNPILKHTHIHTHTHTHTHVEFAEEEGFEPPDLLQSTVFKTAAFDRSANSPGQK